MKVLYVFALTVGIISCRPQDQKDATIISSENTNDGSGNYNFMYETSNGIFRQESGVIKEVDSENSLLTVEGFYFYTAPNNLKYLVEYTSDENGFRPKISIITTNPETGVEEFPDRVDPKQIMALTGLGLLAEDVEDVKGITTRIATEVLISLRGGGLSSS